MPTYRAYKRDSGFYIRSNINSSFITLQVSLAAEKFLRGLSYGDEDSLSWHLIIPLMQQGHITTGEAGPSEQEVEADVDTSQSAKLNPDERTALQEFLSTPNSDPSPSEKAVTAIQRLDPTLSTSDIQECWEAAHNTEAFTASVTTMADQHPIQVKGFGVNQGHPAYLFSTRGIRWKAFESFEIRRVTTSGSSIHGRHRQATHNCSGSSRAASRDGRCTVTLHREHSGLI